MSVQLLQGDCLELMKEIPDGSVDMVLADDYEVPNLHCGDCVHWKVGKGGKQLPCKRIDHDSVKFASPFFRSYDGNQHSGCICSDFYPATWNRTAVKIWPGFEAYWKLYVEYWLPYKNTDVLFYFTLHNDASIRYGVPLMDFVNGTMIDGNTLKAVEKMYYKQDRNLKGFGYRLIREPINGVQIRLEEEQCLNKF